MEEATGLKVYRIHWKSLLLCGEITYKGKA